MSELWKPVTIAPYGENYEVSSLGRVRRTRVGDGARAHTARPGRVLRPAADKNGYHRCDLSHGGVTRTFPIHRLVTLAFIGPQPSDKHEVAHNDGNPKNNTPDNLRWATRAENAADSVRHGTISRGDKHYSRMRPERVARGERNASARLTEVQVRNILTRAAFERVNYAETAREFGVNEVTISHLVRRKTWRHISPEGPKK